MMMKQAIALLRSTDVHLHKNKSRMRTNCLVARQWSPSFTQLAATKICLQQVLIDVEFSEEANVANSQCLQVSPQLFACYLLSLTAVCVKQNIHHGRRNQKRIANVQNALQFLLWLILRPTVLTFPTCYVYPYYPLCDLVIGTLLYRMTLSLLIHNTAIRQLYTFILPLIRMC